MRCIRTNISNLDVYMGKIGGDIAKFNDYAKLQEAALRARGHRTHDLLNNPLKGYEARSDQTFTAYIQRKKEDCDDGKEISPNKLMLLARNKFTQLSEAGRWNAPSAEEEKATGSSC